MRILTLETTCDETAAAVVTDALEVLSSVVASQDALHERFGGVVPEIASRAHVERILPVIDQALREAHVRPAKLDAIAVAVQPGLAGSLLVGLSAAKALAVAHSLPLVAIDHVQAHIFACRLSAGRNVYPCVGLVVSGGHTSLYDCQGPLQMRLLGGTIDDAAGEAFDKVASLLGLPYPGGPAIQRAAQAGNPQAYAFPRSFMGEERLDFSFSGLKTAVRYQAFGTGPLPAERPPLEPQTVADLAASFEQAVVDVLVGKALQAVRSTGLSTLCVGGGVAANRRLRELLAAETAAHNIELHIAPTHLCTDNAVMGALAVEHLRAGQIAPLDLDVKPGLQRPGA